MTLRHTAGAAGTKHPSWSPCLQGTLAEGTAKRAPDTRAHQTSGSVPQPATAAARPGVQNSLEAADREVAAWPRPRGTCFTQCPGESSFYASKVAGLAFRPHQNSPFSRPTTRTSETYLLPGYLPGQDRWGPSALSVMFYFLRWEWKRTVFAALALTPLEIFHSNSTASLLCCPEGSGWAAGFVPTGQLAKPRRASTPGAALRIQVSQEGESLPKPHVDRVTGCGCAPGPRMEGAPSPRGSGGQQLPPGPPAGIWGCRAAVDTAATRPQASPSTAGSGLRAAVALHMAGAPQVTVGRGFSQRASPAWEGGSQLCLYGFRPCRPGLEGLEDGPNWGACRKIPQGKDQTKGLAVLKSILGAPRAGAITRKRLPHPC